MTGHPSDLLRAAVLALRTDWSTEADAAIDLINAARMEVGRRLGWGTEVKEGDELDRMVVDALARRREAAADFFELRAVA